MHVCCKGDPPHVAPVESVAVSPTAADPEQSNTPKQARRDHEVITQNTKGAGLHTQSTKYQVLSVVLSIIRDKRAVSRCGRGTSKPCFLQIY